MYSVVNWSESSIIPSVDTTNEFKHMTKCGKYESQLKGPLNNHKSDNHYKHISYSLSYKSPKAKWDLMIVQYFHGHITSVLQ
jgi:hypothetical protein